MPLQTGFLAGMEWCLGVRHHVQSSKFKTWEETEHPRYDVRQADALMEAEGNDPARLRYRNMFWEAVPDGKVMSYSRCVFLELIRGSTRILWYHSYSRKHVLTVFDTPEKSKNRKIIPDLSLVKLARRAWRE